MEQAGFESIFTNNGGSVNYWPLSFFGYCEELDDAVILVEQKAYLDIFVKLQESTITRYIGGTSTPSGFPENTNCYVYREADFVDVIEQMLSISRCTTFLISFLHREQRSRDLLYSLLCDDPAFPVALSKVRRKRQKLSERKDEATQ
jgi:hypothetical protein